MPNINWEPFTTVSNWFFTQTKLAYNGRTVIIQTITPGEVELVNINGNTPSKLILSVDQAARVLKPIEEIKDA